MWTQVALVVLVTALNACHNIHAQEVCGVPPTLWKNANRTCPESSVCADVFVTKRDWQNRTHCWETRVHNICLCPGNLACPVNNDAHRLFSSAQQRIYTCEPVCNFSWCSNKSPESSNGRNQPIIAMTEENRSPDFDQMRWIDCRCARHHSPNRQPPGVQLAVKTSGNQRNSRTGKMATVYTCNVSGDEESLQDPCHSSSPAL